MPNTPRLSADQVLALAPDRSAQRAARGLAGDQPWCETGVTAADDLPPTVWGLCQGSGSVPYQTAVDLTEPAFRCNCPSRKLPCKHALGLLLRWSAGGVPDGGAPAWVHEWHIARAERAARAAARGELAAESAGASGSNGSATSRTPSERAQARRADRVAVGLEELDRWLADQVRAGIAGLSTAGYEYWDAMAARLVDAQAQTAAGVVRRIAAVAGSPERLLGELALLRLLVSGYRRIDTLPEDLGASVRLRVGLPVPADTVLAGPGVRDRWQVLGVRDEIEEHLTVRRAWLRGAESGRPALVLSFALAGQPLAADLVVGTEIDADLCFYPGGRQVRALVGRRHGAVASIAVLAAAMPITDALAEHAEALAADPWVERWPMLLDGVAPVREGRSWHLVDASGAGLPLDPAAGEPWRLVALAGGRPVPLAGEWSAAGLRPLSAWSEGRLVKL